MEDDGETTLETQFAEFARFMNPKKSDTTITLYNSDFWMRQSRIINDRKITLTDTGVIWWTYGKSELNYEEWLEFVTEFCKIKDLDLEEVKMTLTNCGLPTLAQAKVPAYKDFIESYRRAAK